MIFPTSYRCLDNNFFAAKEYSIVPVRYEDRLIIMKWRNEQMYHLRQDKRLTERDQNIYFEKIVSKLFAVEKPSQILFSYLENDKCIGYGGLVHINWLDKNAEISFIMDTSLEKQHFKTHWSNFLQFIEKAAFNELNFHKIYIYSYNLRPHLYIAIETKGFKKEARLHEHYLYNGSFIDILIYSKIRL